MPHDKDGNLLSIGDTVSIEAVIQSILMQEDYCNITIKTTRVMPPYSDGTSLTLNAKQVTKVNNKVPT